MLIPKDNGSGAIVLDSVNINSSENISIEANYDAPEFKNRLEYLFEHAEVIVSRIDLMNHLWDDHQFIDDNTLSVNMNRLRKKLEDIGLHDFIHTKKGLGYLLCLKTI